MTGTLVVVGAGPGIGLSVSRRFGRHGFRVALVARNEDRLRGLVTELGAVGVEASAYPADVRERGQIVEAFDRIHRDSGSVDVLEWGPWSGTFDEVSVVDVDEAAVEAQLAEKCLSTVTGVRQVLPGMLTRGRGTILITTGGAAVRPVAGLTPYAMAAAAERMYALQLHHELKGTGIRVGIVTIRARVGAGIVDADDVAEAHWRFHTSPSPVEIELR